MVQQGAAMLGATQMQNTNVHVPKLSHRIEDNSRGRLRRVMGSITHADRQESQGISTAGIESCLNWVQKM